MIISPEAISFFISGKKVDDKTIFKIAKIQGINIQPALKKNISNGFSGKHKQTNTTRTNIKDFAKELVRNTNIYEGIDCYDSSSKMDISTPELNLKHIESGYKYFFKSAKLEKAFVSLEINKIFKVLYDVFSLKEKGVADKELENILLKDDVLSKLDLENDVYIDISEDEIIHGKFSLNLLLYLCACLDVNNGRNDFSIFQLIFEKLLSDMTDFKAPFEYYVSILREIYLKDGIKKSYEEIAETLDIGEKSFYRYRKGDRKVHAKYINKILDNSDILYFCIIFWVHFMEKFSKIKDIKPLLVSSLNEYPRYFDIALLKFNTLETSGEYKS